MTRIQVCAKCDAYCTFESTHCHRCDWRFPGKVASFARTADREARNIAVGLALVAAIRIGEHVESRVDRGDAWGEIGEYHLRKAGLWTDREVTL